MSFGEGLLWFVDDTDAATVQDVAIKLVADLEASSTISLLPAALSRRVSASFNAELLRLWAKGSPWLEEVEVDAALTLVNAFYGPSGASMIEWTCAFEAQRLSSVRVKALMIEKDTAPPALFSLSSFAVLLDLHNDPTSRVCQLPMDIVWLILDRAVTEFALFKGCDIRAAPSPSDLERAFCAIDAAEHLPDIRRVVLGLLRFSNLVTNEEPRGDAEERFVASFDDGDLIKNVEDLWGICHLSDGMLKSRYHIGRSYQEALLDAKDSRARQKLFRAHFVERLALWIVELINISRVGSVHGGGDVDAQKGQICLVQFHGLRSNHDEGGRLSTFLEGYLHESAIFSLISDLESQLAPEFVALQKANFKAFARKPGGVVPLFDEETCFPRGKVSTLTLPFQRMLGEDAVVASRDSILVTFRHSLGPSILYKLDNSWLSVNRHVLNEELWLMMRQSSVAIISSIWNLEPHIIAPDPTSRRTRVDRRSNVLVSHALALFLKDSLSCTRRYISCRSNGLVEAFL